MGDALRGQVQSVVVVGAERRVALGTLALARLVARAQTVPAEHVETFREYCVLAFHLEKFVTNIQLEVNLLNKRT